MKKCQKKCPSNTATHLHITALNKDIASNLTSFQLTVNSHLKKGNRKSTYSPCRENILYPLHSIPLLFVSHSNSPSLPYHGFDFSCMYCLTHLPLNHGFLSLSDPFFLHPSTCSSLCVSPSRRRSACAPLIKFGLDRPENRWLTCEASGKGGGRIMMRLERRGTGVGGKEDEVQKRGEPS